MHLDKPPAACGLTEALCLPAERARVLEKSCFAGRQAEGRRDPAPKGDRPGWGRRKGVPPLLLHPTVVGPPGDRGRALTQGPAKRRPGGGSRLEGWRPRLPSAGPGCLLTMCSALPAKSSTKGYSLLHTAGFQEVLGAGWPARVHWSEGTGAEGRPGVSQEKAGLSRCLGWKSTVWVVRRASNRRM